MGGLFFDVCGFNTQPPEGGCPCSLIMSTLISSFNTQPPEGGCALCQWDSRTQNSFNTQPPEGGCQHNALALIVQTCVSTHSRPKAAVLRDKLTCGHSGFQHTAARRRLYQSGRVLSAGIVSTHSRPKAAVSPRFEAGCKGWFQHTAARRRLLSR